MARISQALTVAAAAPCGSRLPLLIDFLDIMCEKLVLPSLAERVRTLRNSYNTATMMYNKFQRLWMEALDLPTNQLVMDFAWSLFIYLKGVWAPRCVDCGVCFAGSDHAACGVRRRV